MNNLPTLPCPISISKYPAVTLAHGGGGLMMHNLIDQMFTPAFKATHKQANQKVQIGHDSAILFPRPGPLAFTTDSFVVRPLFFPGGDIGSLAVHGTINDLAMSGALPRWLSVSFVIEEGLPIEVLWKIVCSLTKTAIDAQVEIVTGDTKVVERGRGDGIFINTTGIGEINHQLTIHPTEIRAGDAILLSGDIGRHGVAVMASREGLVFETTIESDSASLVDPILALLQAGLEIHCLRDCTRGGLISTLNELAISSHLTCQILESAVPVLPQVHGACEMLGLDPMSVANEGRFVAILPANQVDAAIKILRAHSVSNGACLIGNITPKDLAPVFVKNSFGTSRIASMLSGEQLPRIC